MAEKPVQEDYPYNLLIAAKRNRMLELPSSITKDVYAGIAYALFLLEEEERDGIDVKTVSSMLGHSSAGFTLATYTHATNKVQEQAAAKMGNLLKQAL